MSNINYTKDWVYYTNKEIVQRYEAGFYDKEMMKEKYKDAKRIVRIVDRKEKIKQILNS